MPFACGFVSGCVTIAAEEVAAIVGLAAAADVAVAVLVAVLAAAASAAAAWPPVELVTCANFA